MHSLAFTLVALLGLLTVVSTKVVVVTVGHNSTENADSCFDPPTVTANVGDVVYFNFTQGNHTVTQSVFAAPCMRAHDFNQTINGFDSGFRNAGNYNAITNLQIHIDSPTTIWYFDWNTCNTGGVGAINVNETSSETYDGFVRNALRLNGTENEPTASPASSSSTAFSTAVIPSHTSNATQEIVLGMTGVLALIMSVFTFLS